MGNKPASTRNNNDLPLPDAPVKTVICPDNNLPLIPFINAFLERDKSLSLMSSFFILLSHLWAVLDKSGVVVEGKF
ncbi:hypothetical protein M917_2015 [Psychrobacter aquaticus CMS 56]|uniref:Uncharacterized protein n=1 Tax=Psychrobacter aquaticus CMS 56 TaxID=1354303 RepID=U4T7G4_9GAMM|nr:hypothetical protein M917_2015 [Psychrobacter aquaticus CMS 56]